MRLVAKLGLVPSLANVVQLAAAGIAEESCRIVGMPGFYPARKVGADYVERFTPIMQQRLVTAANRLAAMLNRVWR